MSNPRNRQFHHPATDQLDLAAVMRAAGDPLRLELFRVMTDRRERTCGELADELGIPFSTCSYHLKVLREAGITRTRPAGTSHFMTLRADDLETRFPGLVALVRDSPAHHGG